MHNSFGPMLAKYIMSLGPVGLGSPMGGSTMSSTVKRMVAEKAIAKIESYPLRQKVAGMFAFWHKKIAKNPKARRHPSDLYSRHHRNGLTNDEYVLMAKLHGEYGIAFRALEPIFGLFPASGNGAQRGVERGRKLLRKQTRVHWNNIPALAA